jgi:signal recognition particle receptor subunit beta
MYIPYPACQASKNVKVLVFANKQDLTGALSAKQLIEALGINEIKSICVSVRECSVYKNTGLVEGFTWLVDELNKKS